MTWTLLKCGLFVMVLQEAKENTPSILLEYMKVS